MDRRIGPVFVANAKIAKTDPLRFEDAAYQAVCTNDGVSFTHNGTPVNWFDHDYINVIKGHVASFIRSGVDAA